MRQYDIAIIGGGIHGVGVAQAAAAAGYRCVVIEQYGLAWGTSSRSSKLIHGGLRYLETGQFGVVRECLHERALLLRNAPDLVALKPFCLPVYRSTSRRPWQIRAGLALYYLLSGGRFSTLPRCQWDQLDGLTTRGLQQVFRYYDAQTDDRALTSAVMDSAMSLGAELLMPASFAGAELGVDGATVHVIQAGCELELQARLLVNAAGPWVNGVLQRFLPQPPMLSVDLIQGSHLVLDRPAPASFYYVEAPTDRRAVFIMPWQRHLMIGTTEEVYTGRPEEVSVQADEQRYLLDTYRYYFPNEATRLPEVLDGFAGLRVLPAASSRAFHRSRETILYLDRAVRPRVLTIYGGKLTAYRAVAQRVMGMLQPSLPYRRAVADTAKLPLRCVTE